MDELPKRLSNKMSFITELLISKRKKYILVIILIISNVKSKNGQEEKSHYKSLRHTLLFKFNSYFIYIECSFKFILKVGVKS
jgi:hypothetical protein